MLTCRVVRCALEVGRFLVGCWSVFGQGFGQSWPKLGLAVWLGVHFGFLIHVVVLWEVIFNFFRIGNLSFWGTCRVVRCTLEVGRFVVVFWSRVGRFLVGCWSVFGRFSVGLVYTWVLNTY